MAKYRIISFDGGGVRGALAINLLRRLNDRFPYLIEKTDLLAGTSTGAILALGLASGLKVKTLASLYSAENARFIFTPRDTGFFSPKYDQHKLYKLLSAIFTADLSLKDLKKRVLIPAFKLDGSHFSQERWSPIIFHNLPGSPWAEEQVINVVLSSTAAPVYFPPYQNKIDGGIVANNPELIAISYAVGYLHRDLKDVLVLSLGTGFKPQKIRQLNKDWGLLQWLLNPDPPFPLISINSSGLIQLVEKLSALLLGSNYYRINPELSQSINLDEYHKIPLLKEIANSWELREAEEWLKRVW